MSHYGMKICIHFVFGYYIIVVKLAYRFVGFSKIVKPTLRLLTNSQIILIVTTL
jgi:hypothetical protein